MQTPKQKRTDELIQVIKQNPNSTEAKKADAELLKLNGYKEHEIADKIKVHPTNVSSWLTCVNEYELY